MLLSSSSTYKMSSCIYKRLFLQNVWCCFNNYFHLLVYLFYYHVIQMRVSGIRIPSLLTSAIYRLFFSVEKTIAAEFTNLTCWREFCSGGWSYFYSYCFYLSTRNFFPSNIQCVLCITTVFLPMTWLIKNNYLLWPCVNSRGERHTQTHE